MKFSKWALMALGVMLVGATFTGCSQPEEAATTEVHSDGDGHDHKEGDGHDHKEGEKE